MDKTKYFPHLCTCGKELDGKEVIYTGSNDLFGGTDWYSCPDCETTFPKFRDGGKSLEKKLGRKIVKRTI